MERLQGEVLEDLLPLSGEETADFLDASLLEEKRCVLKLTGMVGVVTHQEFSQVDAGVEAFSDAGVNSVWKIS